MDFFTRFTREKTPQNNFSSQNFSVENNYCLHILQEFCKKNPKKFTTDFATNFAMDFSTDFAIYVQNSNQFAALFAKQFAKY